MTWEEFVKVAVRHGGAQANNGCFVYFRPGGVECDKYGEMSIEAEHGENAVCLLPDVFIAWGKYCKTLKADQNRCNGAGVCGGPLKVEVKE